MNKNKDILFLFDVDGTLSPSREQASEKIIEMLRELKKRVFLGFVGGSDLCKQKEQIGDNLLEIFDYGFPENGVQYYKNGNLIESESIVKFLGDENYIKIVNKIMIELSKVICPKKRGNFIELRNSMINICPIGRTCSKEERKEFFEYDKKHNIRKNLKEIFNREFEKYKLQSVIGGQISIDMFPIGWDKSYSLKHIEQKTIIFFGDMTHEGGNDYEIAKHARVKGITVISPDDTFEKVNEELELLGIEKINL